MNTVKKDDNSTLNFVTIDNTHYTIQGDIIAQGGFAQVKIMEDSGGNTCLAKILPKSKTTNEQVLQETEILKDKGISKGMTETTDNYIIQMEDLGTSVKKKLEDAQKNPMTDKERLDLAIGAGAAIYGLHQGRVETLLGRSYTHRDVKPENFVVSKNGKVRLIDYGTALPWPKKKLPWNGERDQVSSLYVPHARQGGYEYTGEEKDIFMLKRVLSLSNPWEGGMPDETFKEQYPSILTDEICDRLELKPYLKTNCEDDVKYNLSAASLTAILIRARLLEEEKDSPTPSIQSISYEDLKDPEKALAMINLYEEAIAESKSLTDIAEILQDPHAIRALAAIKAMDCYIKKHNIKIQPTIIGQLKKATSHEEACVIIYLKALQIEHAMEFYDPDIIMGLYILMQRPYALNTQKNANLILTDVTLAQAIIKLEKDGIEDQILGNLFKYAEMKHNLPENPHSDDDVLVAVHTPDTPKPPPAVLIPPVVHTPDALKLIVPNTASFFKNTPPSDILCMGGFAVAIAAALATVTLLSCGAGGVIATALLGKLLIASISTMFAGIATGFGGAAYSSYVEEASIAPTA
jgi:serine/threonine protein kinase